jgi:hypothetical protein
MPAIARRGLTTAGRRAALLALVSLLAAAAGCSTTPTTPTAPPLADADGCAAFASALDEAVLRHGVADAETTAVPGLPGLRVDRTGAALRHRVLGGVAPRRAWLERAAALDAEARAIELAQLPASAWPIGSAADAQAALQRAARCRTHGMQQLDSDGDSAGALRHHLAQHAQVPDRYSLAARTAGLYPLARWPFFAGVLGWQQAHAATMARWASSPPTLRRFQPAGPGNAAVVIERNALGLPMLAPADAERLLAWHAPVFEIEQRGDFDRFGAPMWLASSNAPSIDTTQPVVYQRLGHMRLAGVWRLQLVYTLWFPERPARSAFDLLAGRLDGLIVRLTLGEQGEVLLVDSIHACGCYHLFFASGAVRERGDAPRHEEWLFAPQPLPTLGAGQRLVVRIASATHYLSGLGAADRNASEGEPYTLRPEAQLRALARPDGRSKSLYGPDGLVAGTGRGERFFFWPMGIASAGAMRQWGHHATAFVGRRHFDDPALLEERFQLLPAAPP